ncbi:hypothetical protein C3486_25965 [Streptomyces sp. Ru73]|uniref:GAF domain-containing protein n=1 Tax=Streptomyces sp. Ru73 TaxID=2080748 RepID=UPI000CDD8218|nr:GAF domain-containing protein [Streptomyces sp. Ru73]POX37872.1 hypothetical protein C3486_25965 [Streptomyces sp. Ru73]
MGLYSASGALELIRADPADQLGTDLEDLQYTLVEGPTLEAARTGRTAGDRNLMAVDPDRWPAFTSAARTTSVHSVIALPLRLGAATLGALTGYRTTPCPFAPTS